MKATPNLNFTTVEPTKDSLKTFVTMLRSIYENLTNVINGHIGFGDGTNRDNVDGSWINVVTPVAPNTDFTVNHNLGRLPVGYWIMFKDRAVDVYTGSVAASNTALTLRATVASAVIRLFVVGLLLGLLATKSEAQGASHQNIAFFASNTSAGTVIKPISSALITVCNGAIAPSIGTTCSGTASIFSNVALTSALSNPTNADFNGNYLFFAAPGQNYIISVSGVGIITYSYVWVAPIVSGGAFSSLLSSSCANPATAGVIRLCSGDGIDWRNNANNANLFIGIDSGDNLRLDHFPSVYANRYVSASINASSTGTVQLASGDSVGWKNNANNADLLFGKDTNDNLTWPNSFVLGGLNTVGRCVQTGLGGLLTIASGACGTSSGTLTATGAPAAGNLAQFSGATSLTNGNLSGDCTTAGALAITCTKTGGVAFSSSATVDATNASNISSGILATARLPSRTIDISFIIDGSGAVITTGVKGDLEVPFACTISGVTLLADQAGSIVVDIWKNTFAGYPPLVGNSITSAAIPTITAAAKAQDLTLTGWTKTINAGDTLRFNVNSAATITRVTVSLRATIP